MTLYYTLKMMKVEENIRGYRLFNFSDWADAEGRAGPVLILTHQLPVLLNIPYKIRYVQTLSFTFLLPLVFNDM